MPTEFSRRSIAKGSAWAAPAIVASSAAPALAASNPTPPPAPTIAGNGYIPRLSCSATTSTLVARFDNRTNYSSTAPSIGYWVNNPNGGTPTCAARVTYLDSRLTSPVWSRTDPTKTAWSIPTQIADGSVVCGTAIPSFPGMTPFVMYYTGTWTTVTTGTPPFMIVDEGSDFKVTATMAPGTDCSTVFYARNARFLTLDNYPTPLVAVKSQVTIGTV